MLHLNYHQVKATSEMLDRLSHLKRWTDIITDDTFNEMAKQALNSLICYFLASFVEESGESIDWTRFPKYALYRAFEKTYVVFNTPKSKYLEIFQMGNISSDEPSLYELQIKSLEAKEKAKEKFAELLLAKALGGAKEELNQNISEILTAIKGTGEEHIVKTVGISPSELSKATKRKISEIVDPEFSEYLSEAVGTTEERIYKASTCIATYIELLQIQPRCEDAKFAKKLADVMNDVAKYQDLPGFKELTNTDSNLFKLLQFLSDSYLRHHLRWCELGYLQPCSILGHLYSTAVWAYIMSLEECPGAENLATKRYFMGIFHDIAEAWTTDLPSPIKDYIKGLRKACELFEDKVLEENIYSKVPKFLADKIHEVMFEEPQNVEQHKALIKGADYLDADDECKRQYRLGSRDPYFWGAILRRQPGIDNGSVTLTPLCGQLRQYFKDFCRSLNLERPIELEHMSEEEFDALSR